MKFLLSADALWLTKRDKEVTLKIIGGPFDLDIDYDTLLKTMSRVYIEHAWVRVKDGSKHDVSIDLGGSGPKDPPLYFKERDGECWINEFQAAECFGKRLTTKNDVKSMLQRLVDETCSELYHSLGKERVWLITFDASEDVNPPYQSFKQMIEANADHPVCRAILNPPKEETMSTKSTKPRKSRGAKPEVELTIMQKELKEVKTEPHREQAEIVMSVYQESQDTWKQYAASLKKLANSVKPDLAKALSLKEAKELVNTLSRINGMLCNVYDIKWRSALTHLIDAHPTSFSTNPEAVLRQSQLWDVVKIIVKYGERGQVIEFLDGLNYQGTNIRHWDGFSNAIEAIIEKDLVAKSKLKYHVFKHASTETAIKFIQALKPELDEDSVPALQKIIKERQQFGSNSLMRIIKAHPEMGTSEFLEWIVSQSSHGGYYDLIQDVKELNNPQMNAVLHTYAQTKLEDPSSIREYLKAFPELDKEPFIKKIIQGMALEPEQMARDFLSGKNHGLHGLHPMMFMHPSMLTMMRY